MSAAEDLGPKQPSGRGRPFAEGNPGRPPGSKNRSTLIAQSLLDGEGEELLRKAIEVAKTGDVGMLKFLLSRILPRERPVKVELPDMSFADDAVEALGSVAQAVAEGNISPSEAASLATLINCYSRAIDIADLVARMDQMERKLRGEPSA
jgi:hypothetical protein